MIFEHRFSNKKRILFLIVASSFLLPTFLVDDASAVTTISWHVAPVPLPINYGFAEAPPHSEVSTFTVTDTDLIGGGIDSIVVQLESRDSGGGLLDNISMTLLENPADNGIFTNEHVVVMHDNARFMVTDDAIVTVQDNCFSGTGNCNSVMIETLAMGDGVFVYSDTDDFGIDVELTETGPDTGLFTRTIQFTTVPGGSDDFTAILEVSPGDRITVEDALTSSITNGLILPSADDVGSIITEVLGTVSVKYNGASDSILISDDSAGPGRGGGGIVRPSVVVDSPPGAGGGAGAGADGLNGSGCTGDCNPPTLGINKNLHRIVFQGFSYNNNPVDVELFYTPYPLITANVGQENLTVLKIYDDGGTQNIAHVGLGFGLGKGESFNDSKATINLDISRDGTETTTLYDPENVLENVRIVTAKESCAPNSNTQCLVVFIYHTFRESLNFNMVATYVWDFYKNAWQNYYNHGIEIVGESLNPPKTELVVFGTHEMKGLYELVRVDKKEDIWQDEFGNLYQNFGNNRFDVIYKVPKEIVYDTLTMHGCDRDCNWFESYKLNQELLAELQLNQMLNGKIIDGESPKEPFSHYFHIVQRSDDPILQKAIQDEIIKSTELYEELFNKKNHP